jgi:hypothetical protein
VSEDFRAHVRDETVRTFQTYKGMADKAVAQISDEAFFRALDGESNSIAIVMKHVGGNLRSRWSDFLTSDGEKADRDRDGEFEAGQGTDRASVIETWEDGWCVLLASLEALSPADMERSVTIRREPHTVTRAIQRSLAHTASHVGQIVMLAKHYAGDSWQTLSIPRGKSNDPEWR